MRNLFISILFISMGLGTTQARLLQNDVTGKETVTLNFKEACMLLGHTDLLLVDPVGRDQLDCMGKNIKIIDSCLKKKEREFLKAYILEKEVVCEYGKQVILSLSCDERDKHYCKDPQKSCEKLKELFAKNLNLMRQALVERSEGKVLNCFFDTSK